MEDKLYDILIIGAAPAGLSAGIYGARQGNSVLIIEKEEAGGQAVKTSMVENYPGFDPDRPSNELIGIMQDQATRYGADLVFDEITSLDLKSEIKTLQGRDQTYKGRSVIIATGAYPRKLNIPGEDEFTAKGVGYCAVCDAPFYQDLEVYVVGAGNSAIDEALYLSKFARRVIMLVRGDEFTGDQISVDKINKNDKIEVRFNKSITEFRGDTLLREMTVRDNVTGEEEVITPRDDDPVFGVFIFIGNIPHSDLVKDQIKVNDWGYIPTDECMRTELDLVYAAGDVRDTPLRQVITAASDGAIAAHFAGKDLEA